MADDTVLSPRTKQWYMTYVKQHLEIKSFVKIQDEVLHVFDTDRATDKIIMQACEVTLNEFGTILKLVGSLVSVELILVEGGPEMRH